MMKVIFSICISISITSANSLGLTSFTSANKMGFPSISTSPNNAIYGNHPFASRILKVEGAIGIDSLDDVDGFENIRIGFDNIDGLPQSVVDVILVPAFAKIQRALQVVPVAAGTTITTSSTTAFGTPNSDIPSQYNSPGESDVDFFMLVYQDQEFCGENTLAFARTVEIDSFDRPTYGAMNLCGSNFDTNGDPDTINFFQMIVIHETFHALGFSSEMLCRFRDPQTGKPLTPRDSNGNCQIVERDCVGDSGRFPIRAPSENYFAPGSDAFGKLSYYLSTPKVLSIVRAHFNCPTLPGLMFENIPTSDSCFGDHADEQYYQNDLMSAIAERIDLFISPLNLAYFEDSSWYRANYTMSSVPAWGHGATCDFFSLTCPQIKQTVEANFFSPLANHYCDLGTQHCSASYMFAGGCTDGIEQGAGCASVMPFSNLGSCPMENQQGDSRCFNMLNGNSHSGTACFETRCVVSNEPDSNEISVAVKVGGSWATCLPNQKVVGRTYNGLEVECPNFNLLCPEAGCEHSCAGRGDCDWTTRTCDCYQEEDKNFTETGCVVDGISNKDDYVWLDDGSDSIADRIKERWEMISNSFKTSPDTWSTEQWITIVVFFLLCLLIFTLGVRVCLCILPGDNSKTGTEERRASRRLSQAPPVQNVRYSNSYDDYEDQDEGRYI